MLSAGKCRAGPVHRLHRGGERCWACRGGAPALAPAQPTSGCRCHCGSVAGGCDTQPWVWTRTVCTRTACTWPRGLRLGAVNMPARRVPAAVQARHSHALAAGAPGGGSCAAAAVTLQPLLRTQSSSMDGNGPTDGQPASDSNAAAAVCPCAAHATHKLPLSHRLRRSFAPLWYSPAASGAWQLPAGHTCAAGSGAARNHTSSVRLLLLDDNSACAAAQQQDLLWMHLHLLMLEALWQARWGKWGFATPQGKKDSSGRSRPLPCLGTTWCRAAMRLPSLLPAGACMLVCMHRGQWHGCPGSPMMPCAWTAQPVLHVDQVML